MSDAPIAMGTWRCPKCGRLLARVHIIAAQIEIKCERCGLMNTWDLSHRIDVQPMS